MPRASQAYDDAVASLRKAANDPDTPEDEREAARRALEAMGEDPDEGEDATAVPFERKAQAYAGGRTRIHPRVHLVDETIDYMRRKYYQ